MSIASCQESLTQSKEYRADRTTKTTRSGGVFVLVVDTLICSEQPQLRSECEITWVKLEVVGTQPLYLAAFYKPKEDDQA